MQAILSVDLMRRSDAATIQNGTSDRELMYRAGEGIFSEMKKHFTSLDPAASVAILCGSGNNAGDGYVLALLLHENHIPCTLYLCSERFSACGSYYYQKCLDTGIPTHDLTDYFSASIASTQATCASDADTSAQIRMLADGLSRYTFLVDCLLGTGFRGTPRTPFAEIICAMNLAAGHVDCAKEFAAFPLIVCADINSGLNGDSGLADQCVISDLTVSIGSPKPGLYLGMAKDVIRKLANIDIGIPPLEKPFYLFEKKDAALCFQQRMHHSHKGTYGYIGLIGGSFCYSGAIRLANQAAELSSSANAAMRCGAGVVMAAAPKSLCSAIRADLLESTLYPLSEKEDGSLFYLASELDALMARTKLIAIGMGIGQSDDVCHAVTHLLTQYTGTLIIDADGLNCLASMAHSEPNEAPVSCDASEVTSLLRNAVCRRVILTPHLKEFSRLSGHTIAEIQETPIALAKAYAKKQHVILLLKGETTIVTDGDDVFLVDRGCPGMATAGSGDVLSGILSAVCAYNTDHLLSAVCSGAYLNGLAGELAQARYGSISMIASDTIHAIPEAIQAIQKCNE